MALNRIYVSQETDIRLRSLKAKTGLTPNLICRLGLCVSLAEPGIPDPKLYEPQPAEDRNSMREFNRYTLTGQWDSFFFALLRERLAQDNLDVDTYLEEQFKAHLCRGVAILQGRVKSIADFAELVEAAQRRHQTNVAESPNA